MRDYKILKLVNSLDEEELKEFRLFSDSAFYCRSRNYSGIFKAIEYYKKEKVNFKDLNVVDFFSTAFPGKNYNNKTLRNRFNELSGIFEKYIVNKKLEENYYIKKMLLLKGLSEKKLVRVFESEYNKINFPKDQEDKSHIIAEIKMLKVYLSRELRKFNLMFRDLNEQIDYTLLYFLEIFFMGAVEYEIEKTYNVNPQVNLLYDIMGNLNAKKLIKIMEERYNPSFLVTLLNYYLYKSIAERKNTEWFLKFKQVFYRNLEKLSDNIKDKYLGYMVSYYFFMINDGNSKYLNDVFGIYKLKLRLNLLMELREIRYPSSAFRDYIVVGIRLKKYKWVENFIEKYSFEVPEEIRDEEVCMAYTRLFTSRRQFDLAINMLNKMKSANYLYVLDASRTKLRIFYEISEFEEAFLEMDRIKHYMKNNPKKVARSVRAYTREFLDKYNTLLKLRLSPDKNELKYFVPRIMESQSLVSKDWFIEKVNEMQRFAKY